MAGNNGNKHKDSEHQELKPRILVFGIGGAGGNAVNNMMLKNLEGAEFVAANTDAQALQQSNAQTKLQLGLKKNPGTRSWAKPEVGTRLQWKALNRSLIF